MRQPRFAVSTMTICILAVLGVAIKWLKPLVPPQPQNALAVSSSDFMRQGGRQRVDWKPMSVETFALARREDKPVFVVLGVPWSFAGRVADRDVFVDSDVQAMLAKSFVAVRIDLLETPEWTSAFLPLMRAQLGQPFDFQMVALTPDGRVFDFIPRSASRWPFSEFSVMNDLIRIRDHYQSIRRGEQEKERPGELQAKQAELLVRPPVTQPPDFRQYASLLHGAISADGNLSINDFLSPYPLALRFMLLIGDINGFTECMDSLLKGPLVDWLDGGFFRQSGEQPTYWVEFDKTAMSNAEMMTTVSLGGVLLGNERYARIGKQTFDTLFGEFLQDGLVRTCRRGDEQGDLARSQVSSFSVSKLREVLPDPADRQWVRDHLHMRTEENPQMVPFGASEEVVAKEGPKLKRILDALRKSKANAPREYVGEGILEPNAVVAARAILCARLWGDSERLQKATVFFDELDAFRLGDDVRRTLLQKTPIGTPLQDYLAFADAALQDYLATGRVPSIEAGYAVLRRAKALFETTPGVWRPAAQDLGPGGPLDVNLPQIADGFKESSTAMAIRLQLAYGKLFGPLPGPNSKPNPWVLGAGTAVTNYGAFAADIGPMAAGYFCAALGVEDDLCAFAVGPNAVEGASKLFQRAPWRLVAPAIGPVRPDLQKRAPGIYVVSPSSVVGPLDQTKALATLAGGGRQ